VVREILRNTGDGEAAVIPVSVAPDSVGMTGVSNLLSHFSKIDINTLLKDIIF
jgi:hypothetical protein